MTCQNFPTIPCQKFYREKWQKLSKNRPSPQPSSNRGVSKRDGLNFDTIFDRADIYENKRAEN